MQRSSNDWCTTASLKPLCVRRYVQGTYRNPRVFDSKLKIPVCNVQAVPRQKNPQVGSANFILNSPKKALKF